MKSSVIPFWQTDSFIISVVKWCFQSVDTILNERRCKMTNRCTIRCSVLELEISSTEENLAPSHPYIKKTICHKLKVPTSQPGLDSWHLHWQPKTIWKTLTEHFVVLQIFLMGRCHFWMQLCTSWILHVETFVPPWNHLCFFLQCLHMRYSLVEN